MLLKIISRRHIAKKALYITQIVKVVIQSCFRGWELHMSFLRESETHSIIITVAERLKTMLVPPHLLAEATRLITIDIPVPLKQLGLLKGLQQKRRRLKREQVELRGQLHRRRRMHVKQLLMHLKRRQQLNVRQEA
jgi:hypothetical protein